MLFCRSAPFVYLVMLACFIVKNRLLLFCAAVTPAEPRKWELDCVLRAPSTALFPKFLPLLLACQPPKCCRSCTSVGKGCCGMFCKGRAEGENVAGALERQFYPGSGINGLKLGWWRASYVEAGCIWLWLKVIIILDFGKCKPSCRSYFLLNCIIGLWTHQPSSHFKPTRFCVLLIVIMILKLHLSSKKYLKTFIVLCLPLFFP